MKGGATLPGDSPSETMLSGDEVYTRSVLSRKVHLPVVYVGSRLDGHVRAAVKEMCEGRCVEEGYVKMDSVKIMSKSCGVALPDNAHVEFHVVFECMVCYPVEGAVYACYATTVTKAGVTAEIYPSDSLESSKPLVIYIARDHHYNTEDIDEISKNDRIRVRCLGVRFELNDTFVSAIAEYKGTLSASDPDPEK